MKLSRLLCVLLLSVILNPAQSARVIISYNPASLNLVPFPKNVVGNNQRFVIGSRMVIMATDCLIARTLAEDVQDELERTTGSVCVTKFVPQSTGAPAFFALFPYGPKPQLVLPPDIAQPGGYRLVVSSSSIVVGARTIEGMNYGTQTLRQLIRANLINNAVPGISIADYPSIEWRGFLDDITRGRSPLASTIEHELDTAIYLKNNYWTPYIETQFEFKSHPQFNPQDGTLTQTELQALVAHSIEKGIYIVGCQQSFAHFQKFLDFPEMEPYRETIYMLNPLYEPTYKFLDDLYAEQIPYLNCPLFNVCCDEAFGLGTGPAKVLADQIGVGGVFTYHVNRIYDIITGKYGKKMLMWGDFILRYPQNLHDVPSDVTVITWCYEPDDSFNAVITPFKNAGFDFFVAPSVLNTLRILPEYTNSIKNIKNFIRDGAAAGCKGVMLTSWPDSAEELTGYNWHGDAWSAECAWNASTTSYADFSNRVGAVLFGDRNRHYSKAIDLIAQTHPISGYLRMKNDRFWAGDWGTFPLDRQSSVTAANQVLAVINPAIDELNAAKADATANAYLLDYVLFGAKRMQVMATRMFDFNEAADAYQAAYSGSNVAANIAKAVAAITRARDGHVALKLEYQRLWLEENRPYYLSTNLKKYDVLINRYNEILAYLTKSGPLSSPVDIGLTLVSLSQRPTSPKAVVSTPLDSGLSWSYPLYNRRIGLDLPMPTEVTSEEPVEVVLPATVGQPSGYQLVFIDPVTNTQYPINSQISLVSSSAKIAFIAPRVGIYQSRRFLLYYGSGSQTAIARTKIAARTLTAPTRYTNVVTAGTNGMIWVDNGVIRVLIGPEGAHIYRWEIKSMSNRDITEPGEKTWQGFADINGANRSAINTLTIVEQGPSLVRIRSLDAYGMQKTFHIWAGVPWVEVTLNTLSTWFCTYDDITLLGANTLTPGKCIFSDGYSEPIRPWSNTNYRDSEVRRDYVTWGAKYNLNSIVLGLLTPDVVASHTVGPGYDGGGPRLEWKVPATHFVIYGDKCPADPALEMNAIGRALDYRKTIKMTIYASENQPG